MNQTTHYRRIIGEWCKTTGMEPWSPDEGVNILVDDTDVGLVHKATAEDELLEVFIDLGFVSAAGIQDHLLRLNSDLVSEDCGRYALHPENGSLLYRLSVMLGEGVDGASLFRHIARERDLARTRVFC